MALEWSLGREGKQPGRQGTQKVCAEFRSATAFREPLRKRAVSHDKSPTTFSRSMAWIYRASLVSQTDLRAKK